MPWGVVAAVWFEPGPVPSAGVTATQIHIPRYWVWVLSVRHWKFERNAVSRFSGKFVKLLKESKCFRIILPAVLHLKEGSGQQEKRQRSR